MGRPSRYAPEVRERAVRLVLEHERYTGRRPGLTTEEFQRREALERENRELRRANEILRKASVSARGDSYDNALAASVSGLYKTEVINRRGAWRSVDAVELATLDWVDWFHNSRLLAPIGYLPPVECEGQYYRRQETPAVVAGIT